MLNESQAQETERKPKHVKVLKTSVKRKIFMSEKRCITNRVQWVSDSMQLPSHLK